jgi:nicotinamidase-related amidase
LDVAHPVFWLNAQGEHPEPFTTITKQDVIDGIWKPFDPKMPSPPYATLQERMIHYVSTLEEGGRYQLTIWPPHCRIGTPGHTIVQPLQETLWRWETERYKAVEFVLKGDNIFTEHYSGVQAEVPDPKDAGTHLNRGVIQALQKMDLILFSGEASSHCVANTMRDIAQHFDADVLDKWVLLEDAMSPVPGFEQFAEDFFQEMRAQGVTITTTLDFSL